MPFDCMILRLAMVALLLEVLNEQIGCECFEHDYPFRVSDTDRRLIVGDGFGRPVRPVQQRKVILQNSFHIGQRMPYVFQP